jgi:autotransporter-associated beta strand protein
MTIADNGYANIENYINGITHKDRQFFLRAPMMLELTAATTNSLTLQWADYTEDEEGFIVEMKQNGNFVEVGRTDGSWFTVQDAGLKPATAYVVRVCAYKGEQRSDYMPELTVKTRPEQAELIDVETFKGNGEGEWLINPLDDETITLTEATPKTAVVVYTDANVTIGGEGYISGTASMNKAGNGTLTIMSDQQYEGATVLHGGTYAFSTLKNGGEASGLGKSQEFAQNWVMDGGTYLYTGGSTTTNRSARLYNDTELSIAKSGSIVTMNGSIEGQGDLTINGEGQLLVNTPDFFKFDGDLVLKGGTVKLAAKNVSDKGIGTASKLVMAGGEFVTIGKNESSVTYNFPIEAQAGTTSKVSFDLWNTNKCKVSGTGTLIWDVHYLREYIEGNWDGYTGRLIINGSGKNGQSQFAVRNGVGVKNATIELRGNASVNGAKNASTYYLGGLSGAAGTSLAGFNVKQKGEGTWVVGTANTNETFRGVINDNDQAGTHPGKTSIEKQGSGDWRLTGKNTYSGTTAVTGGRLIINGQHTGKGTMTVRTGATLAGTGSLAGTVTINAGGTLQVGDTLVSDHGLTFSGGLKLNNGAILRVNEAMTDHNYQAGDKIQAFSGSVSGTFSEIQPATPGEGLVWDTSELYSKGLLKVATANAIDNIVTEKDNAVIYDLGGHRHPTARKGIFIQDNKKMVRK